MRCTTTTFIAILCLPSLAHAQIGRQPERAPVPKSWLSFSVGVMDMTDVHDGSTQTQWEFGNAVQYRISLEMPIQNQTTIGILGAFARVPLAYVPGDVLVVPSCSPSCDADATVTQLMVTFHAGRGSGIGFHQIIDISLGAVGYSSFRARQSGARLEPRQLDPDPAAGIGYGFGYAFAPDMQITLVQDAFVTVHQRSGVGAGENTLGTQYVLRLGTRFGF
jgi:hypothetical protein